MVKNTNSPTEVAIQKAKDASDSFTNQVNELTLDRMNEAPKQDIEPQIKLSQKDIEKSKDIYLKPKRAIGSKEKFDEKWREPYNYAKTYVHITAEHREIIGESIEMWTKPYPGMPAEFWEIPTNKPVWVPRYVANQIKRCTYHRLRTENGSTGSEGGNQFYGTLVVDNTIQRLDAMPVLTTKTFSMGSF